LGGVRLGLGVDAALTVLLALVVGLGVLARGRSAR